MKLVAHFDMDAFFAAVEERDRPEFRGLPIVVGADPRRGRGRGVVSTANYPARAYGVHSALPISQAWRLSEAARRRGQSPIVFLPARMPCYTTVSDRIMAILRRAAPVVEIASIDEAYVDLSQAGSVPDAECICRELKAAILAEERLTVSVGLAPNKLIAKIASGLQKPDGLTVVPPDEVPRFLAPLSIRLIPGIGPKTGATLERLGVTRVEHLTSWSGEQLYEHFGKRGLELYKKVRGHDDDSVTTVWIPKSIGEQETFERDTRDTTFLLERLRASCQEVIRRMQNEGFSSFRTVVVTVRYGDFQTTTRAHTLSMPASDVRRLQAETLRLFLPFLDRRENPQNKPFRLLGVRIERFA